MLGIEMRVWRPGALLLAGVLLAGCDQGPVERPAAQPAAAARPKRPQGLPPEMNPYRDAYLASALTYNAITAKRADTAASDSKFLGQPYWPLGMEYPHGKDRRPLQLLAQINFAEMAPLEDFPEKGILQFFVSPFESRRQIWGMLMYDGKPFEAEAYFNSMLRQDFFRVVYHPEPVADPALLESRFPQFPQAMPLPITHEARLSFTQRTGPVLNDDVRFASFFGKPAYEFFSGLGNDGLEIGEAYFQHAYQYSLARVGGYAVFTQEDPRKHRPREDWILLLEIESSGAGEEVEVMWGDMGIGAFFIRKDALRRRDFSQVLYYWDNH